jgi:cytochrome c-type biogenesis protein CcmE
MSARLKPRHKRLILLAGALAALGIATVLVLSAFRKNLVFFFTPTQVLSGEAPQGRSLRIGGLVEAGTLRRQPDGVTVSFVVTDLAHAVTVSYRGILPDLFKEGKGVVAQGRLGADRVFVADQVLAKHDENYMPPEAADAIRKGARERATAGAAIAANDTKGKP